MPSNIHVTGIMDREIFVRWTLIQIYQKYVISMEQTFDTMMTTVFCGQRYYDEKDDGDDEKMV